MAVLPPLTTEPGDLTIKTELPNALHFRRGHHYARTRNFELEIPIPSLPVDATKPDWMMVRKVWWGVINLVYLNVNSPMRLSLEMRITGDSNILMAPQRGNSHGTVSIEFGTLPDTVPDAEWALFCQKVTDMLIALAPESRVRPHWAKEWCVCFPCVSLQNPDHL